MVYMLNKTDLTSYKNISNTAEEKNFIFQTLTISVEYFVKLVSI